MEAHRGVAKLVMGRAEIEPSPAGLTVHFPHCPVTIAIMGWSGVLTRTCLHGWPDVGKEENPSLRPGGLER